MKKTLSVIVTMLCCVAVLWAQSPKIEEVDKNMAAVKPDENGVLWYSPATNPAGPVRLIGFYWHDQNQEFANHPENAGIPGLKYNRMPLETTKTLTPGVKYLAKHTSGGQLRFRCNAKQVILRAVNSGFDGMNHMPQTGSGGFDLYVGDGAKQTYCKTTTYPMGERNINSILYSGDGKMHDFTINFPLYQGIESVEIGVNSGTVFETPLPFEDERVIVIYGTSITQGGCASRPGSLFTNVLSRRLNRQFINLGFSGNGCGEPEMAEIIGSIKNPAMIILDYEANADMNMDQTIAKFMEILRTAQPETPIVIMSRIRFANEALFHNNTMADPREERAAIRFQHQKNEYEKWIAKGDKNIYFIDGGTLLGDDYADSTVDGIHPTDVGFYRMADSLEPHLRAILNR